MTESQEIFMKYLFIFLLTFSLLFAYEWTPICEEDYSINGFVQNFEGNYPFVLACDEGLLLKNGDDWILENYGGLPVLDIYSIGANEFLLIQGAGSYSDGIYVFNENSLSFSVVEWLINPIFLVYNASRNEYYVGAESGLYKSIGGAVWEEIYYFSDMNCQDMVFWQTHYAVSVTNNNNGVYYSDDYGITWNLPTSYKFFCDMAVNNDSKFFGIYPGPSNSSGLWSSIDFGATWQIEFMHNFNSSVNCDMAGNIFVGWDAFANEGVALWENGEIIPMNNGLPCLSINKLYVNPVMSVIHIMAFTDSGAYILNDYTSSDPVLPAPKITLTNHPNPFNPSTEISFQISDFNDQNLEIQIFNTKGQRINTIPVILSAAEQCNEGSVTWNGTNSTGKSCPSGVYFYKLVSGDKELAANKMLLLK
jgi:hypothetical protein